MTIIIGFVVAVACMLGGFVAMGGHLDVLVQPWEFVIIGGTALGAFIISNPITTIKDTGKAILEAFKGGGTKNQDYLDLIGLLYNLMNEIKAKTKTEIESHIDEPEESTIFQNFPEILANKEKLSFLTDYVRIILIGNARPHEIEALMEEEIHTLTKDKLKPYVALQAVADALPAIGIIAAVMGIIKAMGALDQPPEVLGHLIGAALVGTFAGIFMSYGMAGPLATIIKNNREKQSKQFVVIKQTLIAFMNGASPNIAIEHGRKTISTKDRPTLEAVEDQTMNAGNEVAA